MPARPSTRHGGRNWWPPWSLSAWRVVHPGPFPDWRSHRLIALMLGNPQVQSGDTISPQLSHAWATSQVLCPWKHQPIVSTSAHLGPSRSASWWQSLHENDCKLPANVWGLPEAVTHVPLAMSCLSYAQRCQHKCNHCCKFFCTFALCSVAPTPSDWMAGINAIGLPDSPPWSHELLRKEPSPKISAQTPCFQMGSGGLNGNMENATATQALMSCTKTSLLLSVIDKWSLETDSPTCDWPASNWKAVSSSCLGSTSPMPSSSDSSSKPVPSKNDAHCPIIRTPHLRERRIYARCCRGVEGRRKRQTVTGVCFHRQRLGGHW